MVNTHSKRNITAKPKVAGAYPKVAGAYPKVAGAYPKVAGAYHKVDFDLILVLPRLHRPFGSYSAARIDRLAIGPLCQCSGTAYVTTRTENH